MEQAHRPGSDARDPLGTFGHHGNVGAQGGGGAVVTPTGAPWLGTIAGAEGCIKQPASALNFLETQEAITPQHDAVLVDEADFDAP